MPDLRFFQIDGSLLLFSSETNANNVWKEDSMVESSPN